MSSSFERIGTTAYGYVTVFNAAKVRQTGHVIGDFTVVFYDPAGDDITGDVVITMSEFLVSGSPIGAYRFAVPIPADGDEGAYALVITDPLGRERTCIFNAYVTLQGDTGDTSAQLELIIRDVDGGAPSAVDISELTVRIYNPSMEEVSSEVSPTLTELEDGLFLLGFEIGSGGDEGDWFVDVIDSVRFPQGKQSVWTYFSSSYEIPDPPDLSGVNDDTGTSVTLTYVAESSSDRMYTYYSLSDEEDWTLALQTRLGSGIVQITGLVAGNYDFFAVASQSGSATINQSAPSNVIRITVATAAPSAATDNVRSAVKAMNQKAVYWAPAGPNEFGKPTWENPVEIDCRWTDKQEEFIDPNGEQQMSRAKLIVDRDILVQGVLWLGLLINVVDSDDPKNNDGAWEILLYSKLPDKKGTRFLRQAYL